MWLEPHKHLKSFNKSFNKSLFNLQAYWNSGVDLDLDQI